MNKNCKKCGDSFYSYNGLMSLCNRCYRDKHPPKPRKQITTQRKPIKQRGKKTLEYEKWRDTVAIPYLIQTFGRWCVKCGKLPPEGAVWDVDHIKNRSTHPHLKMVLTNVQFMCRPCHSRKTDGLDK